VSTEYLVSRVRGTWFREYEIHDFGGTSVRDISFLTTPLKRVFYFQSMFVLVTNRQTTVLIANTGQQYVCNLVLFHVAVWHCNLYGFLPVEAMASPLSFSTIVMAGLVHYRGFPGNIGQTWLSLRSVLASWSKFYHSGPILCACIHSQECVSGDGMPQILGHPLKGLVENDQFWVPGHWLVINLAILHVISGQSGSAFF